MVGIKINWGGNWFALDDAEDTTCKELSCTILLCRCREIASLSPLGRPVAVVMSPLETPPRKVYALPVNTKLLKEGCNEIQSKQMAILQLIRLKIPNHWKLFRSPAFDFCLCRPVSALLRRPYSSDKISPFDSMSYSVEEERQGFTKGELGRLQLVLMEVMTVYSSF